MASFTRIVLAVLVASAASHWISQGLYAFARQNHRVSLVGASNLILLNGAAVNWKDAQVLSRVGGADHGAVSRTLVIAASDTCPGVQEILPKWRELIGELPGNGDVALTVVNMGGSAVSGQLVEAATTRGVPYQVLAVVQQTKLSYRTGLVSTPWSLVLDADNRVRRASMGFDYMASAEVQGDFRRCLVSGDCLGRRP